MKKTITYLIRGKLNRPHELSKMRFILLFAFILHLATGVYAQTPQFNINLKDASLKEVFNQITEQSDYSFVYGDIDIKDFKNITINVKNASIQQVLQASLKGLDLEYEIHNKVIILRKAKKETTKKEERKKISIRGKTSDKDGYPLPGATVLIKGTFKGTTTNENGNFSIEVPPGSILVFSFIGYQKQEVVISEQSTEINVVMQEAATELGEVAVISTGYQLIKPEQSTGSIATMKVKEYDSRINTTDFLTSLENRIPGLLINNDVEFEGNSLFQIRGISTIKGNKQPLIVIDGYPTELSLDMLNPNEIESVTVLKDAAASTVYGVRASNGVIVVERKKAKAGKVHVNFRATAGFKPKENYDRYRWDDDGSNISIAHYQVANWRRIRSSTWGYLNSIENGNNYNFPTPGLIMAQRVAGIIETDEKAEEMYTELGSYNNANDYARLFLRTAVTQTYNLDISGGDRNALYYITANYSNNDASQIKNDNSRFMLSARTTVSFSKRFSMDLTTDIQETKISSAPIPSITSIYPYEKLEDEEGNPLPIYNGSRINPYYNDALMELGLLDNLYYPLVDINEISDKSRTLNNRITANFRYNIGNGFNLNFGGVYESSRAETKHLANENSSEARQYINRYTEDISTGGFYYNIPKGGFLHEQKATTESYTLRAQLNYNKQINKDHSLNAIFGSEIRNVIDKVSSAAYFGYNDQTLLHQGIDYRIISDFSVKYARSNRSVSYDDLFGQEYVENRYFSIYSNLVYAYKGKYSLTGSIRIDQSNLFGTDPKYKYKPLWSLGAAWNIHKETFMQNMEWLKSLKLRLAYGFNGNVAKDALPQAIARAGLNKSNSANPIPMLRLSSYANSGLRWEQTQNFNTGLDFSIFENITGSIDYYIKKSTDLLATTKTESTSGATTALINKASIRNNGFEITLHADWITHRKFNWNTGLVFSHNTSKVLDVYNSKVTPTSSADSYTSDYINYLKGYPLGAVFSYRYAGVDAYGYPLVYDKDGETKRIRTLDDGINDVDYHGTSIPVFNIGLSNRVDVGNFYFYCMFNFYGGFKARIPFSDPASTRPLEGAGNYWKQEGDEENPNTIPKAYTQYVTYTDKYTVNGAYLTLGDLTASYSFRDSQLVKKIGISNLEVRAQASNLFTIGFNDYNYSIATGSYAKSYLTPTYTIGLYVNF